MLLKKLKNEDEKTVGFADDVIIIAGRQCTNTIRNLTHGILKILSS